MTKPLVIYHADCADGFGAAFAAWLKFGYEAEYLPMQYGQDYSKSENTFPVEDREIYILDFSFPRKVMDVLFARAKRVVWLDHHRTAFEMWCDDGERIRCEQSNGNDEVLLDNNKSGALLAWEYFHPGTEVPMLIQHIDDRDRWQFKLEGSKELHAALASLKPWSFEQWREKFWSPYTGAAGYHEEELLMLYQEGAAILRAQDAAVVQAVKHARKCMIDVGDDKAFPAWDDPSVDLRWFPGLAVSCPLHQSEIGHELAKLSDTFGLIWYMAADGRINCSLRSNGDYDVSAIAKAFGGGGHKNAAGFQTDVETLTEWLK